MKKDYTAIKSVEQKLDDLAFVDKFWTERWLERGLDSTESKTRHISTREEYRTMSPYLDLLPHGSRLLDAGCGLGEWTVFLSQKGFDVVGLDISEPAIKALKIRFPKLTFVHGDIRQMGFPDNHFDGLFSWGAFEHFESGLQPCLVESCRVLKPGGYLFITIPYHNLRHMWLDQRRERTIRKGDLPEALNNGKTSPRPSFRFYQWRLTKAEFAMELAISGFMTVAMKPVAFMEGIGRTLEIDLKLKPNTFCHRMGIRILRRVLPADWVSHMIMAIARKPQ